MSDTHAHSAAFVRDSMLPPEPPPVQETGAIKWLRENLFSGPVNTVVTLVCVVAIWLIVSHLWPWFSRSVWNADSLAQCRQIIAETWGEGKTGACFAVIRERWNQFIFGFYPPDLYWRPTLTFGLLFAALTPVLFSDSLRPRRIVLGVAAVLTLMLCWRLGIPGGIFLLVAGLFAGLAALSEKRMSWMFGFTLLYPFLGVWLLWGGSVWGPLSALAGFGLFGLVIHYLGEKPLLAAVVAALAAVLWWLFLAAPFDGLMTSIIPVTLQPVGSKSFGGFLLAITIGVSGIALSLPMGILLALGRRSNMPIVKAFSVGFIEFIRGVPLITLLFVASILLNYFLPPGTNFDIILRVIIMVTLFASAYVAEVIRGGLAALPKGQYEAADALGLDYWKAQRLIILPQALKISIPGIVSTFIGMFKDTTLVGLIGLFDPLKGIPDTIRANFAWKGTYWEPFIFTGAIFFVICFSMSRYSMYLERRLTRDHR